MCFKSYANFKNFIFFHFLIFSINVFSQTNTNYTISGYITEKGSNENLPRANIYIPKFKIGTITNNYGFYSITMPSDTFEIIISYVGYQSQYVKLKLLTNTVLDITLENNTQLQEVIISSDKQEHISEEVQMSKINLPVDQIKNLPALFGEKDVLKSIQLLPGVQKNSEGSSGIYVRGGGSDQNLIILDDAIVYNASHLFGFFSLFNGDALKNIELIKGGFPARYGGRLSSVIDMQMKDGDKEKIKTDISIGLISSRITIEGPIKNNKASFLVSARRTYIDILAQPLIKKINDGEIGYYFYDINAKLNYILDYKNKLYLSGYFGKDKFYMKNDGIGENNTPITSNSNIQWGNATGTLRWNHLINEKMFSNISLIYTNFLFDIGFKETSPSFMTKLNYFSGIRDYTIKGDIDFYPNAKHSVKTGLIMIYHYFRPSAIILKDMQFNNEINKVTHINAYETALYFEDDYKITEKWRTNVGIRLSNFNVRSKSYFNMEPRITMKYAMKKDLSIKASYALMNQYLHLLSNSGIGLPSDLWVPATDKIKPQKAQQIALGIAKDIEIKNADFLVSLEGYYKKSQHIIGYKEGASFFNVTNINPNTATNFTYEDIVTTGESESYGSEFFLQKKSGKLTGWIGYTLSWTWLTFNELNFGKKFPARYDRRHDISIVGMYKLNNHITLSATWVYGTGNAITLPTSYYHLVTQPSSYIETPSASAIENGYSNHFPDNLVMNDFGDKNSFRMVAYHRLDIAVQFHKIKKKYERIFELGIYNVYNRLNPFFYKIETDNQTNTTKLKQVSLFPTIPSVSWTWRF